MSQTFPREKDHIIDDLDDHYDLNLTDDEVKRLRAMTAQQLLLVTMLVARTSRLASEKAREE